MAEVNELTIKLKVDDTEIKNLEFKINVDDSALSEFENNAKQVLRNLEKEFVTLGATSKSTFSNLSNVNSKQIQRTEPTFQMSLAGAIPITIGVAESVALRQFIFGILSSLISSIDFENISAEKIIEDLKPFFEVQIPPDELLNTLEGKVLDRLNTILEAQRIVEEIGERPNSSFNGIPLDNTSINEQIELIEFALGKIDSLRDEVNNLPKITMPKDVLQIPPTEEFELDLSPSKIKLPPGLFKDIIDQGLTPELEKKLHDLIDQNKQLNDELEKGNKVIDEQTNAYPILNNALAMASEASLKFAGGQDVMSDATNGVMASVVSLREKGIEPLGGQTDELADRIETASGQVEQAEGKFDTYGLSLGNVNELNKVFGVTRDQVNQSLDDGTVAFDSAGASAEEFGNTLDQVQTSGGFFDGIKQGFKDFVANVESNSELMADFFADRLSQMSQNFSDLFFNVITGKFDDLQDLAKQAFEAILRAFLDLVSAIATRQIVISIGGLFGIGKGAQAAGGGGNPIDIAQQGAGVVGSGLGLFGAGRAFETLGAEEKENRLAA